MAMRYNRHIAIAAQAVRTYIQMRIIENGCTRDAASRLQARCRRIHNNDKAAAWLPQSKDEHL